MQSMTYKAAGRHQLHIHKDQNGDIWVKAIWTFDKIQDRIIEHLFCEDFDESIFRLTDRKIEGNVSITEAARRYKQFPVNSRIRLETCT